MAGGRLAMSDSTLTALVARLTEALRSEPGVEPEQLDTVRRVLMRDLAAAPERAAALASAIGAADVPPEAAAAVEATLTTAEADETVRLIGDRRATVQARTLSNSMPLTIEGFADRIRNMRADLILGPFRGPGGIVTVFDVFLAAARLTIEVDGEATPLMVLTSGRRRTTQTNPDVDIEPGTVWIRADALATGAPADRYVGVRVTDGAVDLDGTTRFDGGLITVPAPFKGAIRLDLEDVRPGGPDHCPDADVTAPSRLAIRWDGGVSVELGGGAAELFGQTFEFSPDGGVRYDAALNRIVFECSVEPDAFDGDRVETKLARLSGKTAIVEAGWTVPLSALAPSALAEADGEGAWLMVGKQPLGAVWHGGPDGPSRMAEPQILAGHSLFAISSRQTAPPSASAAQRFGLWALPDSGKPLPLTTRFPDPFTLVVGCDTARGDYVGFSSLTTPVLDRPVDALGRPLPAVDVTTGTMLRHHGGRVGVMMQALVGAAPPVQGEPLRLALENAYLSVFGPLMLGFSGTLADETRVVDGELALLFTVGNWMPTLPDPYVTNLTTDRDTQAEPMRLGHLIARVGWADREPPTVAFEGLIGAPLVDGKPSGAAPPGPGVGDDAVYRGDSQTADGTVPRNPAEEDAWREAIDRANGALAKQRDEAVARNAQLTATIVDAGRELMGPGGGGLLLDVSTNRHQIGVAIGTGRTLHHPATHAAAAGGTGAPFTVQALSVWTRTENVHVFTLPLVQWEPVRTLDIDQNVPAMGYFPTPLASPDDGGPTVIGMRSARLTAAIPDLALETMVDEFGNGRGMGMVTTLPFGLKAGLMLQPTDQLARRADTAAFTAPTFDESGEALAGGLQLTLRAEGGIERPGRESPSFQGAAAQLLNGVDLATGAPLGISVLGETLTPAASVETMFNNEFAGANPRVPLTRYDVSGYGGTTFSDWANPQGAFAEATKVQFALMVGRTALEVIKFASMIYPWGIRVTRSVTIERRGGGGVIRRDSGWQASSPGLFDFRVDGVAPNEIAAMDKHPGLIRGVFAVERIRGLGRPEIGLPDGGSVVPMAFDCDVAIDGVEGDGRARVEGMVGYLHLTPVGRPITAAAMAALLEAEGPSGGPIDTPVRIGGTRFTLRGLRVEVDGVPDVRGDLTLVGAVRGTPVFGPSGAWSVIRQPGPAGAGAPEEAETITDGTPVIRSGRIGPPSGNALTFPAGRGDFRFAEAEDLHRPVAPAWEIGLLQTTATHAFLYRRPHIRAGAPRIESTLHPLFADLYARSTTSALFPAVDSCIELVDRPYRLVISPTSGFFRLDPPVALPNPRPELFMSEGPDRMRVDYAGTTLSLEIEDDRWSVAMPDLETWNDMGSLEKVSGLKASIIGGTDVKPQLTDIETLLAPAFETIMNFMPGIDARGVHGPVDLSATNVKVKVKAVTGFEKTFDIAGIWSATVFGYMDVGSESDSSGVYSSYIGAIVGVDIRGQTPPNPWFFVVGCRFEIGGKSYQSGPLVNTSKATFEAKLYVGVGIGGRLGPFEASAMIGIGPVVQYDGAWRYGGFLFLEGKIDLVIVKVVIYAEFAMLGYAAPDASGVTQSFVDYQGEVGIKVKIAVFFSIKVTVQIVKTDQVSNNAP